MVHAPLGLRLHTRTQILETRSRKWDSRLFSAVIWYMFGYSVNRVHKILTSNPLEVGILLELVHIALAVSYLGANLMHVAMGKWRVELVGLFNQLVYMNQQQTEGPTVWEQRERVLTWMRRGFMGLVFIVSYPAFGALEFHYAHEAYGTPYACFHLALTLMYLNCAYVIGSQIQILFVLQLSLVYDNLAAGSVLEYRTLAIMTTIFNQAYGYAFAPVMKYCLSGVAMVCFVGAVRIPGVDLAATCVRAGLLAMAVYDMLMLICGANAATIFWIKSTEYILERRRHPNCKFEAQEHERGLLLLARKHEMLVSGSLTPIRFGVGGLYYMEREARLTFMDFLANGTLTMLIAFKSLERG